MAKSTNLIKKPVKWFALETIGNGLYDLIGLLWRSAIMTTALTIVVRFASAIPPDVRLIVGLFIVALVFLTLQLVIDRWRKRTRPVSEISEGETALVEADHEKLIETLNNRIKELERENKERLDATIQLASDVDSCTSTLWSKRSCWVVAHSARPLFLCLKELARMVLRFSHEINS